MGVKVIPTRTDVPAYTFEIDLEQTTYQLAFQWNDRDSAWYFSIADANGTPLLSGRKIVLGLPLLARFRDPRLPLGDFNAIDTTGSDTEPGLTDLGERVKLLYVESTSIPTEFRS